MQEGDVIELVQDAGLKVPLKSLAIVCSNEDFPEHYQAIKKLIRSEDLERFIPIQWKDRSLEELDGFYARFRFQVVQSATQIEPKDNQGRTTCFWCGAPTKKIQGFNSIYNICPECKK